MQPREVSDVPRAMQHQRLDEAGEGTCKDPASEDGTCGPTKERSNGEPSRCGHEPSGDAVADIAAAPTDSEAPARRLLTGLLLIGGSGLFFSLMSVLTQLAALRGLAAFQIVFISGLVRWLTLAATVYASGANAKAKAGQRRLILIRCMCGFVGISGSTFAFTQMHIGDATAIVFSAPLWASVLAWLVLGEALGAVDVAAILLSLAGVALVARPPFLFGPAGAAAAAVGPPGDAVHRVYRSVAPLVAVVASIGAAGVATTVRYLGTKAGGVHPAVLAHAYALFTVVVSPLGFLVPGQAPRGLSAPGLGTLLAVGVGALAAVNQLMLNSGMQRVPAGLGAMMRNIDIVLSFLWQALLFRQPAEALSVAGSALIVACTAGQALRKWAQQRSRDHAASVASVAGAADGPGRDAGSEDEAEMGLTTHSK